MVEVINSLHTHINKLKKFNYKKIFMSIIKNSRFIKFRQLRDLTLMNCG